MEILGLSEVSAGPALSETSAHRESKEGLLISDPVSERISSRRWLQTEYALMIQILFTKKCGHICQQMYILLINKKLRCRPPNNEVVIGTESAITFDVGRKSESWSTERGRGLQKSVLNIFCFRTLHIIRNNDKRFLYTYNCL